MVAEERARDRDCLRKLHALQEAALPDWPDPDPGPPGSVPAIPFEDFARRLERDGAIPDAFFIARWGSEPDAEYTGYSGPAPVEAAPRHLASAGTAVRPEVRRRGVAARLRGHPHGHGQPGHARRQPAVRLRAARPRRDPAGEVAALRDVVIAVGAAYPPAHPRTAVTSNRASKGTAASSDA